MSIVHSLTGCIALAGIVVLAVHPAHAQPIYKSVGPDGKVTFSDRAPDPDATPATISGSGNSNDVLPFKLRQIANKYPVTLYSSKDCDPCNSARNLLAQRGIPFNEKTIDTNEDIEALKRLSGSSNLPFGTIGSQHLKGFSDAEWSKYLDAAGYPKESELPKNYRRPSPTPLVVIAKPPEKKEEEERETPPQSPPPTSGPGGIVF